MVRRQTFGLPSGILILGPDHPESDAGYASLGRHRSIWGNPFTPRVWEISPQ